MKPAITALIVCLLLSGCTRDEVKAAEQKQLIWSPSVFLDEETGCQYLAANHDSALTPRLNAEGKQICHPPTKGTP